jgi:AcrR family transcriptional regulator
MGKGDSTRAQVLEVGLDIASELGLEGLTIGTLAARAGLSKSGMYAHFESKEALQCAVLHLAAERFTDVVLKPAFAAPRGLPRLERLMELWMRWETDELPGGCPFVTAASDYDDREGPVRDLVVVYLEQMMEALRHAATLAVEEGHFAADLDPRTYAFDLWGVILAYAQWARLLKVDDAAALARGAFARLNAAAAA